MIHVLFTKIYHLDQFSKIAEKKHNAFNVTLINSYSSVVFFQNMQLVNQAYLIIHYTL